MLRIVKMMVAAPFLLAAGNAAALTTSQADCATRPGGTQTHTVGVERWGLFPTKIYACPNDRIQFKNTSDQRVQVWVKTANANNSDWHSGVIQRGNTSGTVLVKSNMNVDIIQDLSDYGTFPVQSQYNDFRSGPFVGKVVMGVAPMKYVGDERYEDPD